MKDFDVYVQVAETTVKTYRVRVTGSAKREMAEATASAEVRRQPEAASSRFEETARHRTTYQILTAYGVELVPAEEETP